MLVPYHERCPALKSVTVPLSSPEISVCLLALLWLRLDCHLAQLLLGLKPHVAIFHVCHSQRLLHADKSWSKGIYWSTYSLSAICFASLCAAMSRGPLKSSSAAVLMVIWRNKSNYSKAWTLITIVSLLHCWNCLAEPICWRLSTCMYHVVCWGTVIMMSIQ
jgi:hypothetical protein